MGKWFTPLIVLALFCSLPAAAQSPPAEFQKKLEEADRLAWLTDWYSALPIYGEVEKRATAAGDRRDAMGRTRLRKHGRDPAATGPVAHA
jgi:hypothetical protein